MKKATKVVVRKLGREQADGLAYKDYSEIHIDERLKGKDYILTLIHELIHIHQPEFSEDVVIRLSNLLTNDLWRLKIRRIDE